MTHWESMWYTVSKAPSGVHDDITEELRPTRFPWTGIIRKGAYLLACFPNVKESLVHFLEDFLKFWLLVHIPMVVPDFQCLLYDNSFLISAANVQNWRTRFTTQHRLYLGFPQSSLILRKIRRTARRLNPDRFFSSLIRSTVQRQGQRYVSP